MVSGWKVGYPYVVDQLSEFQAFIWMYQPDSLTH